MTQCKCSRWSVDLSSWSPTLQQLAQAVAVVQPEERVRLLKFHFIDDFLSSLVGRLLMRKFVSTNSDLEYKEIRFGRDARGKPYWLQVYNKDRPQLQFNVSHQGQFVVLAGLSTDIIDDSKCMADTETTNFGVGVDVMKIEHRGAKSLTDFFRVIQRIFSDNEWRQIRQAQFNEREQLQMFMRHWCLKEAYVKELGVGITIDLQKISFIIDTTQQLELRQPITNTMLRYNDVPMYDWYFEEHLLHPDYCAAISFKNCKPDVGNFEPLKIEQLLVDTEEAKTAEVVDYCRRALRKQRK